MQSELIMKESDKKKNVLLAANLEIEIRQLERKIGQLSVELAGKKEELQKTESRKVLLEAEVKKMKKELI